MARERLNNKDIIRVKIGRKRGNKPWDIWGKTICRLREKQTQRPRVESMAVIFVVVVYLFFSGIRRSG